MPSALLTGQHGAIGSLAQGLQLSLPIIQTLPVLLRVIYIESGCMFCNQSGQTVDAPFFPRSHMTFGCLRLCDGAAFSMAGQFYSFQGGCQLAPIHCRVVI